MHATLFITPLSGLELLVILLVLALLFGPSKLTSLARAAGRSTGEYRKGREEIERELRTTVIDPDADTGVGTETTPAPARGTV